MSSITNNCAGLFAPCRTAGKWKVSGEFLRLRLFYSGPVDKDESPHRLPQCAKSHARHYPSGPPEIGVEAEAQTPMIDETAFPILSYAIRLLATEVDMDKLVDIVLDTMADFGKSGHVELLYLKRDLKSAKVLGRLSNGVITKPGDHVEIEDIAAQEILRTRLPGICLEGENGEVLCFPLIGTRHTPIGLLKLNFIGPNPLDYHDMLILNVLSTLIAISIENSKSYKLATFDGLTGLYVRRHFNEKLREEIMRIRRYGGRLALLIADIDHFKRVNDTQGHQQGDKVLQELAGLLKASVRSKVDIPCRYGGEEFATILCDTDVKGAHILAERFRVACENFEFDCQGKWLKVTVSGGIAGMDSDNMISEEELIRRADAMLYKAKKNGRNRILVWGD